MENHLYECIYVILRKDKPENGKYQILKRYNAKIVCLHARKKGKAHARYRKTRQSRG
jgi:hypothetical protein